MDALRMHWSEAVALLFFADPPVVQDLTTYPCGAGRQGGPTKRDSEKGQCGGSVHEQSPKEVDVWPHVEDG